MEEITQTRLVAKKRIEWIAFNYELSSHAKNRIKERMNTTKTIAELIYDSPLFWGLEKDIVCIAFNLYEYIVVETGKDKAVIKTFIDTRDRDETVIDRFCQFYRGKYYEKPTDNGTNGFGTIRN